MNYHKGSLAAFTALMLLTGTIQAAPVTDAASPASTPSVQTLTLGIGSHHLLRMPAPIARIALGEPKVADVNVVNARELLVLGKAQGSTSLLVWPRGRNARPVEYSVSVGSFGPSGDPEMAGLRVQPGSGIDGSAPNLYAHRRAVSEATPTEKPALSDRSVVAVDTQVLSEIKVVEINRTTAQQYGLNFRRIGETSLQRYTPPGGLSGVTNNDQGVLTFTSATGFIPIVDAFNFVYASKNYLGILSLLERKGLAHTLAEPSLTATSGQTATFLAGGEFPVPVPQSSGGAGNTTVTIQYKEFGVRLNLTPTVVSTSRISLKVAPEVSELDYANGITLNGYTVPGLIVRRTDTTVELGDGETFVLSGLVSDAMKGNVDKVPFLGDLPIIGAFFKSNTYSRTEKELIMVVTPHLVRPLVKGAKLPQLPGAQVEGYRPGFAETMFLETGKFGQSEFGYSH